MRPGERSDELTERAREEGRAVLAAAGIAHEAPEVTDLGARWRRMGVRDIDGRPRGRLLDLAEPGPRRLPLETDYLNGEIVLRGTPARGAHAGQRGAVPAGLAGRPRRAGLPARWPPERRAGGGGVSAVIDPVIAAEAAEIAARATDELTWLVDISSPSGDVEGAERALELCARLLPTGAAVERPACSTPGSAPD